MICSWIDVVRTVHHSEPYNDFLGQHTFDRKAVVQLYGFKDKEIFKKSFVRTMLLLITCT